MFCLKDSEKQIARLHRFHIIPNSEGGDGSLMSRVFYWTRYAFWIRCPFLAFEGVQITLVRPGAKEEPLIR
jgi:hypothetical protein